MMRYDRIRIRLNGAGNRGITAENMEKSQHTDFHKMKALMWPAAKYGCESWTLRRNEETCLDAFEMKGLRKILRVSWTAKKTNEWVLIKAGVKRELLDSVEARRLAYHGHTMRKQGSCLEKEIMLGTMPGARRRGRPRTAWMDNINTWTGLPVKESIRITEDRDKWRKYVHVWTTLASRMAKEQNTTAEKNKNSIHLKLCANTVHESLNGNCTSIKTSNMKIVTQCMSVQLQ